MIENLNTFVEQLPELLGIFFLMLSTFLIGYFSAVSTTNSKARKKISKLKKQVNSLKKLQKEKDLDTLFTEIKPKIVAVVKEAQQELKETLPSQRIADRAQNNYVLYTKKKLTVDFESIGEASKLERDDLTKINGIGPYIEEKLNEIGIYSYDQISRLKDSDIRTVTELIEFFPGRIERDDWVGQAQSLLHH